MCCTEIISRPVYDFFCSLFFFCLVGGGGAAGCREGGMIGLIYFFFGLG